MLEPLPEYRDDPHAYELEERSRPDEMAMITCAGFLASQWLDTTQDASCLDLCCGTGLSLEWLVNHRHVKEVLGVDACANYLQFARRAYARARVVPTFIQGDAIDCHIPRATFDLIMLASAYHHIDDSRKVRFLQRVRTLLTPRGRAVMAENILPPYSSSASDRIDYALAVRHFYDAVLNTARTGNPTLPHRVELLIERVAKHGIDGDYEYKVSWPVLIGHLKEARLIIEFQKRVWPLQDHILPGNAGNHVIVLRAD